jgi:hypothetical protein
MAMTMTVNKVENILFETMREAVQTPPPFRFEREVTFHGNRYAVKIWSSLAGCVPCINIHLKSITVRKQESHGKDNPTATGKK